MVGSKDLAEVDGRFRKRTPIVDEKSSIAPRSMLARIRTPGAQSALLSSCAKRRRQGMAVESSNRSLLLRK